MTYDVLDRLSIYNGNNPAFDLDGNLTSCTLGGSVVSFAYDSGNRLTQAGTTAYTYDVNDNRIALAVSNSKTQYAYENVAAKLSQLLVRTNPDGSQTFYVYGLGLIGQQDPTGYSVYHYDFRGSTVALTNSSGAVTDRFTYGAYGELLTHTGSSDTPFLYNGRDGVLTDANGLYYMRARYYSPELKRFLNSDIEKGSTEKDQTLNLYIFVLGNPVLYVDPRGQVAGIDDLILLGVGAATGLVTTFASDVIANIATGGNAGFSDWQTYVGNTLGGAVGLELSEYSPLLGGAVGGMASYSVTQLLKDATGASQGFNADEMFASGIEGGILGKFGDFDIESITAGRNSFSSVFKSGITKLRNQTASKMSLKVFFKGLTSKFANIEALFDAISKIGETSSHLGKEYASNYAPSMAIRK